MKINFERELALAGLTISVQEFKDLTARELSANYPPEFTDEELMMQPRKAIVFCDHVRLILKAPKLEDRTILKALVCWRKDRASIRRKERFVKPMLRQQSFPDRTKDL